MLEDFEGDWTPRWNRTDHDTASGLDYWGGSTNRKVTGSASAWCAQVGYNSDNFYSNSYNGYYDQDMQAALQIALPDMSGYTDVVMGFYYWAETGSTVLNDYLEVRVWMGGFWDHLWKQPEVDTGGSWEFVYLELPLNAVWLTFTFNSDDEVGLGPYEGVYVDTVIIAALDDEAPSSSVGDLDEYYASHNIYVPYAASDIGGSGVQYVELYYRIAGEAGYTLYVTPDNPDGWWTEDFVPFNCSAVGGDGVYDFYTVAVDWASNREVETVVPQASCTVDTVAPVTNLTVLDGHIAGDWQNTTVTVELTAQDSVSGVEGTYYKIGNDSWLDYDEPVTVSEEGEFAFSYFSEDRAGNLESVTTIALKLDFGSPTGELTGGGTTYNASSVELSWSAEDLVSGVDYCLLKVDDRAFEYFSNPSGDATFSRLEDGNHTATLRVFDNAGNQYETTVNFVVDTGDDEVEEEATSDNLTALFAIGLILLVVIVVMIVLLARKRRVNP